MNGVKPAEICSRHLYQTHIAAGVRQWVLARWRAGRAMWTQRTGGGLWNCRLSRKNKRPAVGAHRWAGGKRQLEGSPVYRAARGSSCGLGANSPSPLVCPFDPEHSPSSFQYHYFSHMYQSYHKGLCKCLLSLLFSSRHKDFHNCPSLRHKLRAVCTRGEVFFYDLLLHATSIFFLSSSNGDCMKPELQSTAQPSGLWISLNTGHSSLSCMWIFSLVQFQIN